MKQFNNKFGFTLIELLLVIGILASLSVVAVLVINPAEITKKARDGRRLEELASINKALNIATVQGITSFGSPNVVYVSLPDNSAPTSTCPSYSLPSLPTGWAYRCSNSANYRKVNGSGWVPVDFASINTGSPLSVLPVDPINSISAGNYYTYVTGGSWELTTILESDRYSEKAINDGDAYPGVYSTRTSQSPLTPGIRDKGMVGYWKMDETSGTLYDSSGHGNNGTQSGGVTYGQPGKVGNALSFDGVDDYVNLGNPSSLKITGDQTISMWLYPASFSTRKNPYNKAYGGEGTITQETDGRVNYYYGTCGGDCSPYQGFTMTSLLSLNTWVYLVLVRDLSHMKLYWYKDNILANQVTATYASAVVSGLSAMIGKGYAGQYLGVIDDVRIYNRALSAAEISAIYNATK